MAESEKELKSLLMKVKVESEKVGKTREPKLSWSKGVLINMVWAYILSYNVVILR